MSGVGGGPTSKAGGGPRAAVKANDAGATIEIEMKDIGKEANTGI